MDPYYFTYEAEKLGYHSQIVLNGRTVNDGMGNYIADVAVRQMIRKGHAPIKSKVVILGLTFKENCPDIRNSKVEDIIRRLETYGIKPEVVDPWADSCEAKKEYDVELKHLADVKEADCVIVAVAHKEFINIGLDGIIKLFNNDINNKVLIDVKGLFSVKDLEKSGICWWRL